MSYLICDSDGVVIRQVPRHRSDLLRAVAEVIELGHEAGHIDNQDGGRADLADYIEANREAIEEARSAMVEAETGQEIETEPYSIEICTDCLTGLADGEVWNEAGENVWPGHSLRIEAKTDGLEITLGHHADNCEDCRADIEAGGDIGHDEGWFSMSQCDGCGSRLGGQRYPATIWIPTIEEDQS